MGQTTGLKSKLSDPMNIPDTGVVVSGISGRFPSTNNLDELRKNLTIGIDMTTDSDHTRWPLGLWGLPKRAGRLRDLSKFDYEFFGYEKSVADLTDCCSRILHEVVYEAILDSGTNPAKLRGTNTGLFFGFYCCEFDYWMADNPSFKSDGLNYQIASKVAQYFGFRGQVSTYDSACASGFSAFHEAVTCMQLGLIDQAVVCSSNIHLNPLYHERFVKLNMLSQTGCCHYLDAKADGYVKSEAVVAVFLERKNISSRIYVSILATGTNADGHKIEGLTYPSESLQQALMEEVKDKAKIHSNHIQYIEAHGTGTFVGDPVEARSISQVYCSAPGDERTIGPLLLGSIKTNIGHTEAVSGLCSLAKVILMLENEIIYKSLHYDEPNPTIGPLIEGKVEPVTENIPLESKIVPICCYGFGGSNVHGIFRANSKGIVKRFAEPNQWHINEQWRLVLMFGRNEQALTSFFDHIMSTNAKNKTLTRDFLALVDSLCSGPIDRLMNHRGYLIVDMTTQTELHRSIARCNLTGTHNNDCDGTEIGFSPNHHQIHQPKPCYFIYPGKGCEWFGMAKGFKDFPLFWRTIERLSLILRPFNFDLEQCILSGSNVWPDSLIVITAIQIALIDLLKSCLEMRPTVGGIIGHSFGEMAAAYASGVLSEKETILLSYYTAVFIRKHKDLIEGAMVAVGLGLIATQQLIDEFSKDADKGCEELYISCSNGPESCTVSGRKQNIEEFVKYIIKINNNTNANTLYKMLSFTTAAHNPHILHNGIKELLKQFIQQAFNDVKDYQRDEKLWLSTVHLFNGTHGCNGKVLEFANAEYFANVFCERVDFYRAVSKIPEDSVVIEIGPHGPFESVFRTLMPQNAELTYVKLMKKNYQDPIGHLFKSIGQLFLAGLTVNLSSEGIYPCREFPVSRQTPFISSLIKWNHSESLFVPKYPEQFSKLAMSDSHLLVDLTQNEFSYLSGHRVDGRNLFPATGYLFYAWRLFSAMSKNKPCSLSCTNDSKLDDLVPIEFFDVVLHRAVILNEYDATNLHIKMCTTIGTFEVRESDHLVISGVIRSPQIKASGLIYDNIADIVKHENQMLVLNQDDIYKQFRVCGYDYGDTFRCILSSSYDGQYYRIKFNGHLVVLMDNLLQAAVSAFRFQKSEDSLHLPTGFDYVRINPNQIKRKQNQELDLSEENGLSEKHSNYYNNDNDIFDVYCEPKTGVILTDGIEIRGIKTSQVPRREHEEPLLEKYQFIADIDKPVDVACKGHHNQYIEYYIRACDNLFVDLIHTIDNSLDKNGHNGRKLSSYFVMNQPLINKKELRMFMEKNLTIRRDQLNKIIEEKSFSSLTTQDNAIDLYVHQELAKNKPAYLLSLMESIRYSFCKILAENGRQIKNKFEALRLLQSTCQSIYDEYKYLLMSDVTQLSQSDESFIRPIIETIVENSGSLKDHTLNILAINTDTKMRAEIEEIATKFMSSINLNFTLFHTDTDIHKLTTIDNREPTKSSLMNSESEFDYKAADVIMYRDNSCFASFLQTDMEDDLTKTMALLDRRIKNNGFVIIIIRNMMSLSQRFLKIMNEQLDLESDESQTSDELGDKIIDGLSKINLQLKNREEYLLDETHLKHMKLVSRKTDASGLKFLLFRKKAPSTEEAKCNQVEHQLVYIKHNYYDEWVDKLKIYCSATYRENESDALDDDSSNNTRKIVWICAFATRDNPMSGIVGLMQCLLKEFGFDRGLRCLYDCYTFKTKLGSQISQDDIMGSENFKLAAHGDMLWNCIDHDGIWGTFRHIRINEYLSSLESSGDTYENSNETKRSRMYANISTIGDLSSFKWYKLPHDQLISNGVDGGVIKVHYSALNFRDIMVASGKLNSDSLPKSPAKQDCILGIEFSGIDVQTNRRVAGMVTGQSIATHLSIPFQRQSINFTIPDDMSLKEAATIPVVYGTAIMAMIYRGKIKAGESILIHAGSGGVGQASIRLALHYRLNVFTTVGSQEKRQFLLNEFQGFIEDCQIFNSRDCSFEADIMRATNGRGVDLILNSFAGDKLQASIRCLAANGRFLEIGKYDLSINTKLELSLLDGNKSFHGILLDMLFETETYSLQERNCQLGCILDTLNDGLKNGYIKPIHYTCFHRNEVEQAFRYMAAGKHIGKVLIEIEPEEHATMKHYGKRLTFAQPIISKLKFKLDSTSTYIVTGGLGGFGMELCKWMASVGARHIVVTSRRGPTTGYQRSLVRRVEDTYKCNILILNNNIADGTTLIGVRTIFEYAKDLSPTNTIGGVFHLAMVIRDKLFESMTSEDFDLVSKPKADGCILLDRVSREVCPHLKLFVAFSSVSCGRGNIGQANYGYANSIMERVCEQRRRDKLHGLAIQWGYIGDIGFAYENIGADGFMIAGSKPQRMPSCFSTLNKLLFTNFAVCSSMIVANDDGTQYPDGEDKLKVDLFDSIMHILGINDILKVDENAPLSDLGLDSLIVVEVSHVLEHHSNIKLSTIEIRSLTLTKIRAMQSE